MAALQRFCQCVNIKDCTARYIDDTDTIFHLGNFFCADHAPCFFRKRRMHGNIVRCLEERIEIDEFYAKLLRPFFRNIRIVANRLHFHSLHTFGNTRTDAADANNTDNFILELDARKAFSIPFALHEGIMGLRNVPRNGHDHSTGMFRCRNRIRRRCIDDDDAPLCSRFNINAVDTDTGTANDFQLCTCFNDLFRYMCHRPGYKSIVFTDASNESLFVKIRFDIYVISMLAQQFYTFSDTSSLTKIFIIIPPRV